MSHVLLDFRSGRVKKTNSMRGVNTVLVKILGKVVYLKSAVPIRHFYAIDIFPFIYLQIKTSFNKN